jgi:hypothetical protein
MLQLSCHLLHPRRIGWTIRDTDTRRVAAERGAGEGINKVQSCLHGGEIACQCVKKYWREANRLISEDFVFSAKIV